MNIVLYAYYMTAIVIMKGDGGYSLLAAYRQACDSRHFAWSKGLRPPGAILYSSREPSELSKWLWHDDSTINTVTGIVINITIITENSEEFSISPTFSCLFDSC